MTASLGFNNTYAIGVKEDLARRLDLKTISDLEQHPELVLGFTSEFMDRADGWPGLRQRYRLPQQNVRGLDHDLAYRGLAAGALQVTDLYATDAEIAYYRLRTLKDDLAYFPVYDAVILYRADLERRAPKVVAAFRRLAGRIDAPAMSQMNARVKLHGESELRWRPDFCSRRSAWRWTSGRRPQRSSSGNTRSNTSPWSPVSLSAAIVVAIPLGILAARRERLGQIVLGAAGIIQTIPSLALLVFMIPLLGIGGPPAIVALFLYSLLPIIRNTHAGLKDIAPAIASRRRPWACRQAPGCASIELPLATRAILAGIKTSAVINVGTATLGALIGAGGYGQPILTGIRLDDTGLILQGAIPAAALGAAGAGTV